MFKYLRNFVRKFCRGIGIMEDGSGPGAFNAKLALDPRAIWKFNSFQHFGKVNTIYPVVMPSSSTISTPKAVADIQFGLKYLLRFGNIIGIYSHPKLKYITQCLRIYISIYLALSLVDFIIAIEKKYKPSDLAWAMGYPIYYGVVFSVYSNFYCKAELLERIYLIWKNSIKIPDVHLQRFVSTVSIIVFASAIGENICYDIQKQKLLDPLHENDSVVSRFLQGHFRHPIIRWMNLTYSPILAFIIYASEKFFWLTWNFGDVFVICFCRAMSFQFKQLKIENGDLKNYSQLMEVIIISHEFVSPLVFTMFGANTYALCMQLHMALTPRANKNTIEQIYSIWSALHLLGRVGLMAFSATRVHDHSKDFLMKFKVFETTPKPFSVSGMEFFKIKRQFVLQLMNVIFAVEVVLLQGDTNPTTS